MKSQSSRPDSFAPTLWHFILLIAGLGTVIYSNSLDASFQFDDHWNIVENEAIRVPDLKPGTLLEAARNGAYEGRPVATVSFAVNHALGGYDVRGYHLVNIAIHVITAVGLLCSIYLLLCLPAFVSRPDERNPVMVAGVAAILWLVHPLQVQAVTYIVQRMASMAAMFVIWTLVLVIKGLRSESAGRKWGFFTAAIPLYLLGLGSKETSVILPVMLIFGGLVLHPNLLKSPLKLGLGVASAGALGFGAVVAMKGLATTWVNVTNVVLSDVTDLFSVPRAVFYNLSLFVLPIPSRLSFEHDIVLSTSLWDPWTTLPTIIALLILCALPLVWIRRSPLFSLGLAWFLVLFLLEALVVKHNLVFEHRFYLPSMGLFLILGILVEKALRSRWRTIAVSTLVLLVAASSWITYQRNTVWQTQLTLMRDATAKAPQKIRARTGLVAALASAGHLMEARKEFREAMTLPLTSNRDLFNLGEAGVGVGEYDQAVTVLQRLAEIDPRSCGTPRYYLAEAYYRKRDVVKALENLHVFERCKDTLGWTRRRASALSEEIVSHLEQELRARPSDATNRMALANTLITRRQPAEAIPHLRTVIELEPGNVAAWASLGFSLFDLGEYTQAESCHRRAIGLQPRFPAPYYGLGQALVMQQRPAEAIPHFQRYLELAPRGDAFRVVAERYLRDLVGGS